MEADSKEGTWSHCYKSEPKCVANSLITKASELALKTSPTNLTVLDLGAGSGRNVADLLEKGATVYAYDADSESISLLRKDFTSFVDGKKLYVDQTTFEDITTLPTADLIIGWRALPFMEEAKFPAFWKKIENALKPNGIFTGTFFGGQHKTRRPLDRPKLFRLSRKDVEKLFTNFQIIDFEESLEYDEEDSKEWGSDQYEHNYRIIAKKKGNQPKVRSGQLNVNNQ